MKSHSRRHFSRKAADPYPFDYSLLSCLYIHEDGNHVLDFGGFSSHQASENEVRDLLRKRGFNTDFEMTDNPDRHRLENIFIHIQGGEDCEEDSSTSKHEEIEEELSSCRPKRGLSRLVSIEDATEHFWLLTKPSDGGAPFARMFSSVKGFAKYIKSNGIKLPESAKNWTKENIMSPLNYQARDLAASAEWSSTRFDSPLSPTSPLAASHFPQPIGKWVDIQTQSHNPGSVVKLKQLLSLFQIHQSVVDKCLYLTKQDSVDMSHLTSNRGGYMFFIINCTPLHAKLRPHSDSAAQGGEALSPTEMEPIHEDDMSQSGCGFAQKSIMELRFEAVRKRLPRCCVPEPVPVGVILFADWIITIHDQPFTEMNDLLHVIQIQCSEAAAGRMDGSPSSPVARAALMTTPSPKRLTTSFVFSAFFQICVGHCADSMVFTQAVNDLSDVIFDVKIAEKKHSILLKYATSTRLCFGECSADVLRRENVITEIFRNDGVRNFLLQESDIRTQLTNVQTHLRSLKNEICECHDAITVANWYANISYYWVLLRNGNRSLRMLLLLAEMVNVLTVVAIFQSIFSMNVRIPFDATADPPSTAKAPFYILAAVLLVCMLWCVRIVWDIAFRKRFKTVALF